MIYLSLDPLQWFIVVPENKMKNGRNNKDYVLTQARHRKESSLGFNSGIILKPNQTWFCLAGFWETKNLEKLSQRRKIGLKKLSQPDFFEFFIEQSLRKNSLQTEPKNFLKNFFVFSDCYTHTSVVGTLCAFCTATHFLLYFINSSFKFESSVSEWADFCSCRLWAVAWTDNSW